MINAVLFDMDGTVIDTEPINKLAWEQTLTDHGFSFEPDFFFGCIGLNEKSMEELYQSLYGAFCPFTELFPEAHAAADAYVEEHGLTVKKGFGEIIAFLEKRNVKRVLVTSSQRYIVEKRLGKCGLLKHFDGLVCGDEVAHSKPDPEPYLKAAKLAGEAPEACLAVEDSANGIRSAYSANIPCVYIRDLIDVPPEVEKTAFKRLNSLDEMIKLFN